MSKITFSHKWKNQFSRKIIPQMKNFMKIFLWKKTYECFLLPKFFSWQLDNNFWKYSILLCNVFFSTSQYYLQYGSFFLGGTFWGAGPNDQNEVLYAHNIIVLAYFESSELIFGIIDILKLLFHLAEPMKVSKITQNDFKIPSKSLF